MDTRALRYFHVVAQYGSYSRAAEILRISQPAVSRQVRKLETELGLALFARHGHGVSLTEPGRTVLERSQAALRQLDQITTDMRAGSRPLAGTIAFAVPPAAGTILLPPLLARFGSEHPNVFLKLIGGFSGYIHERLARGDVDLACVHDLAPRRGFTVEPLVDEDVHLVGAAAARPFPRDHARIEDLAALPLILPSQANASRQLIDRWAARKGLVPTVRIEADNHSVIRALVRSGVGFSLLTHGAIADDLGRGAVRAWPFRPRAHWPLALVTATTGPRAPALDAFIHAVRATARALLQSGAWPGRAMGRHGPSQRA